jgi:coenzyme PQQ precursor peptide PqqA
MMLPIRPPAVGRTMQRYPMKESVMTWETPQAVEIRFGMEITMYVSNR